MNDFPNKITGQLDEESGLTSQNEMRSLSDHDLLRRFVQDSDQGAFAEIVRRFHPMVISVCRRVVGQAADAEDAFQATFVALARRPRSVRHCRSLSSWLYSVAWRTSVRLVRIRSHRAMLPLPDQEAVREPDPLDLIAADRNIAVLDEELNQLPEKYRSVLVMTYFRSQTSQQIADQLAESKGVIDGRLRQARNALRIRLARRGVEIGAIVAAAALMKSVAAASSTSLIESTIGLGAECLGNPALSPVDLSRFEPLIKPEFPLMTSKSIALVAACLTLVVGAAGMQQLQFADAVGTGGFSDAESPFAASLPARSSSQSDPLLLESPANTDIATTVGTQSEPQNPVTSPAVALPRKAKAQYSGFSSTATRSVERRIYEQLESESPELDFPGQVSIEEVLNLIADHVTTTTGSRLTIVPDRTELELEGITSLADIMVQDIVLRGLTLRSALDQVMAQTTDPQLEFIVQNELLVITSRDFAESTAGMFNRYYNVEEQLKLFQSEWEFGGSLTVPGDPNKFVLPNLGGPDLGGADTQAAKSPLAPEHPTEMPQTPESRLMMTIQQMTTPIQWTRNAADEFGGRMVISGNLLIVRQSRRSHVAVADVLEQLEEAASQIPGNL